MKTIKAIQLYFAQLRYQHAVTRLHRVRDDLRLLAVEERFAISDMVDAFENVLDKEVAHTQITKTASMAYHDLFVDAEESKK